MNTQTAITLIAIAICATVTIIYALYRMWDWKHPYVDEIIEKGNYINDRSSTPSGSWYEVKRTYKNGTITYKNIKLK